MSVELNGERWGQLPRLFNAVNAPILVIDAAGRLRFVNAAAEAIARRSLSEMRGRPADELFSHSGPETFANELAASDGATRRLAGSAGERTLHWRCEELELDDGERVLVCTGSDMTEQEAARRAQRSFERQLSRLFANLPALLWATDRNGILTLAEGAALITLDLDREQVLGQDLRQQLARYPEIVKNMERALRGESFSALEEFRGHTFEAFYEPLRDETGEVIGMAGVATDVTERRRQDMSVAQAQKMESLGVMAGSVAHDFNNLLTAILGFAGLLKLSPSLDPRDREQLFHIEQAARRGADIAGRLLSFSRGGLARFVPVDLRDVVQETARLVSPTLPDRVRLALDLPARPLMVEGDDGQLQQALLNIVLNARDALGDAGTIEVHIAADGGRAKVVVRDDGPGIDEATRRRIFEPFFTTKQPGSGTGLGLAITYGIVRGHRGDIAIDSEVGAGTAFTITFPLLAAEDHHVHAETDPGEGNLVLLVDDDELVRRSTSATLSNLGYNVVEVGNGALAVDLVRARPARFAAVLLDLVMPGMTGREVFHAIAGVRPDLPIVVCTGYAADAHIDDAMKRSIAGLLQKPFTPQRLSEMLLSVGARPTRRIAASVS
ncbi:MAG: ATP-binding protein [Hyphomicrobiales bacterium]